MREYDLYVPLRSNNGKCFPSSKLARLRKRLISHFGGITYFPQKNKGTSKIGKSTFRDEIVIMRVLSRNNRNVRKFWSELKSEMQSEWKQRKVLIVVRKVSVI